MMNFGYGYYPSGFGFSMIFMILFWIIVIAGIVALVRSMTDQKSNNSTSIKSALDILKERYARGEIGKEEFEEKKRDLT